MIDFHSHILPCIDDGSKSVDESLGMLRMLKKQRVLKVVATPHFHANHHTVDNFLNRRDTAYDILLQEMTDDLPDIIMGAEVRYYQGISRLDGLEKLTVKGTKLLLLEMPMQKWTEFTLRELKELSYTGKVIIVLAHIERYLKYQGKSVINELVDSGILIQANADFFLSFTTRYKAISMLNNHLIHFIGSDCHNLTSRPPKMDAAISYIKRKAGNEAVFELKTFAERFL